MGTTKRGLGAAAAGLMVVGLAACSSPASGNSQGNSGGGNQSGQQQQSQSTQSKALPKVTPPATPPSLEPDFPVGTWKSSKSTLVIASNGVVTETIKGKTGRALYQDTGSREVRFGPDDGGICDSDAIYQYSVSGKTLKLILTTVDLCQPRVDAFTDAPFTKQKS